MAFNMSTNDKPLAWLHGEVKTPPFSPEARLATGFLLRRLQMGAKIPLPHSRPMPSIGRRCHANYVSMTKMSPGELFTEQTWMPS